jgi:hypothetical protein
MRCASLFWRALSLEPDSLLLHERNEETRSFLKRCDLVVGGDPPL